MPRMLQIVRRKIGAIQIIRELCTEQELTSNIESKTVVKDHRTLERSTEACITMGDIQTVGIGKCHHGIVVLVDSSIEFMNHFRFGRNGHRYIEYPPVTLPKHRPV